MSPINKLYNFARNFIIGIMLFSILPAIWIKKFKHAGLSCKHVLIIHRSGFNLSHITTGG
jgi:hypothetical protein